MSKIHSTPERKDDVMSTRTIASELLSLPCGSSSTSVLARHRLGWLLTLTLLSLSFPSVTASAGTYEVHQCGLPDGRVIGAPDFVFSSDDANYGGYNRCATGGGLAIGAASASTPQYTAARFRFSAPVETRIVRVRGSRAYSLGGLNGSNYALYAARIFGETYTDPRETCFLSCRNVGSLTDPNAGGNGFDFNFNDGAFTFHLECGGAATGPCNAYNLPAEGRLFRADLTLLDNNDPVAGPASGSLVAGGTKTGTLGASFSASDRGGGVYRSLVKVDGSVVDAKVVDANGGACQDLVPDADPYDGFTRAVPCELTSSASVSFDTSTVPDGVHQLSLEVEDAAGNRSVVLAPTSFVFQNRLAPEAGASPPPPAPSPSPSPGAGQGAGSVGAVGGVPNGTNASATARLVFGKQSSSRRSARFGRRVKITGRLLTAFGQPIQGAALDVLERVSLRGARSRRVATVRTDGRGSFSYVAPAGPSRVVDIAYRAVVPATGAGPQTDYDVRKRVELVVPAGIRLAVRPQRARNLQSLRFTGRLLGAPLPRRGKLVLVQAQVKRLRKVSWQTFLYVRTARDGSFSGRYRLTRSRTATGYRFRAVVPRGDDYPFEKGSSNLVKVKIVR